MPDAPVTTRSITRVTGTGRETVADAVVVERGLEIRIQGRSLSVTLRTPGHDRELALGFLAGERVIGRREDVAAIAETAATCSDEPDIVDVTLAPGVAIDWTQLERAFVSSSACGMCGRAHLDTMRARLAPIASDLRLDPAALLVWPATLKERQQAFQLTGGLHAAALADGALQLEVLREDVGRHNAVDKVCGWLLEQSRYPLQGGVLWVSGRAGAEIVLKAARAGIAVVAAVGAPSSLAVELAEAAGLCLVGFLREGRFNVYSGAERLLS